MNKEIKLKIQDAADRANIIKALAIAGYKVWAEEKKGEFSWETNYFVKFILK